MILGIIQARMGSRRFPGKVLKEIEDRPLLWHLYKRVGVSRLIDKVVIATARNDANLPIIKFAQENKIEYFAGEEQDLIDRLYKTTKKFNAKISVRITGDCPLADPDIIDKIIKFYLDNEDKYNYVSNAIKPTYPDGLDVEVIPLMTLERAWNEIQDPFWREWFNVYIIEHPELYRIGNVENAIDLSHLRWTIDYEEDLIFIRQIFDRLYSQKKIFLMQDILDLLEKDPQLKEINKKHVRNSAYYQAKKEAGK